MSGAAGANPTQPQVVHGAAAITSPDARTLQVTNTPGAIINWQGFSIGAGEATRFIQQSPASAVLNRVVGSDVSSILGQLSSNGRVFLVNPHGILFGAGATIDVAGLVASTLGITDADFIAGRYRFTAGPVAGSIVNHGVIRASDNGRVFLIAPDIANHGVIDAPGGSVTLAAGTSATIAGLDQPDIVFEVQAPQGSALNVGRISADGGAVRVFAGTLRHSGEIRADTLTRDQQGNIVLAATKDITLEPGSTVSASGAPGGEHAGGEIRIVAQGTLDMKRGSTVHADGGPDGGDGGFLELSGQEKIALNGTFTGAARRPGYRNGTLLIDPANINITNDAVSATVAVPTGFPMPATVSPDGTRVYIGTSTGVSIIDTATNTVTGTISMAGGGYHIVFNASGSRAYVVNNSANTLSVVDTSSNTVLAAVPTGAGPNHVVLSLDGAKAFVTNGNTNTVTVVNTTSFAATNVTVGSGVSHSTLGPGGTLLYVNNGSSNSVSVLRVSDNAILATIAVGAAPQWNAVSPDGTRVYVANILGASVSVINTATNTVAATIPVGTQPQMVWVTPDGSKAYVINDVSNTVSVIDTTTNTVSATLALGASPAQYFGLTPDGTRAYIPLKGSTSVAVIDTVNATIVNQVTAGSAPSFAAMAPSGKTVYISNRGGGGSVSVIDTASATTTGGVVASGDSPGATLNLAPSALAGAWTNVTLAATNDINVNTALANGDVPAGGSLTLNAAHNLNVNAAVGAAGARFDHDLNLAAGNTVAVNSSIFLNSNVLAITGTGGVTVAAPVDAGAGGTVSLSSTGSVTQSAPITTGNLLLLGAGATHQLTNSANAVGVLAASTGSVDLVTSGAIAVGLVGGTSGVTASGSVSLDPGGTITLNAPLSTGDFALPGGSSIGGPADLTVHGSFNWTGGTLGGGGAFNTAAGSVITLSGAGTKTLTGRTWSNAGTVNWTGGDLSLPGSTDVFNNQAGGTFNAQTPAAVTGLGAFHNLAGATLSKASAGTTDIQTVFDNAGTVNASSGTLKFSNAAGYVQSAGVTNLNGGSLLVSGIGGMTLNGGVLQGTGTLTAFVDNSGATVKPGGSPGTLSILGHYSQGPGGTLEIELGGLTQGSGYDLLSVSGAPVALGGTLNVLLYAGYAGAVSDAYDVIFSSSGFSGSFAAANFPPGYTLSAGAVGNSYRLGITDIAPPVPPLPSFESAILSPASQIVQLQAQADRIAGAATNVPQEPAEEQDRRRKLRECR